MALHESDRDDLIREATALVRRVEMKIEAEPEPVTAGFHRTGRLSVYFGGDPVVHFDESGRLRRAFCYGALYRTAGGTLARLVRHRTPTETELLRHDLTADELADFTTEIERRVGRLHAALVGGNVELLRQVPTDDERLTADLIEFLGGILAAPLQLAPPIPGRK